MMIAKVLVDVKAKQVNKTYDYLVGESFQDFIELGARVVVPFGNRKVMGFILGFSDKTEYSEKLKTITKVLDIESYLNKELIDLAVNLSEESNYLLIRVLETILPSALKVIYKPKIRVENFDLLPEELKEIFEFQSQVYLDNITEDKYPLIKKEIKKNNLVQTYEIKEKQTNLSKKFIRRTTKPIDKLTLKQMQVLEYLEKQDKREELLQILLKKTGVTQSVINTLEKHKYVESYLKEVYRKVDSLYETLNKEITLNEVQEEVLNKILKSLDENKTFLLHGVTGSGKTEVYLKAIEKVIESGKNVLLLVPEISLTPMMISRFKSHFSNLVAAIHSGLS
ncbi:MAG: DEAD/DEAH box helicase family protein, partial [Candidatus Izemoplasmatales bacterium]|nr:DEAD/DEAH box helicase family protein [Candidatus Izemoplasmatales bacterium]